MPFCDILLHIEGYPVDTPLEAVDAAVRLAKVLGGGISALAVELRIATRPNVLADWLVGVGGLAEEAQNRSAASCREALDHFRIQAGLAGILNDAHIVAEEMGQTAGRVAREARTRDFVIHAPASKGLDKATVETILFQSGRPVMVLPEGHTGAVGVAVVAWDGSTAAARAMHEAAPLLRKARTVQLLTIGRHEASRAVGSTSAARHLQRHGIRANRLHLEADDLSTAVVLERQVKASRADVLVMGAYGHSRVREMVLGGVTEHMLHEPSTALWLSH